ncbi:hypothetical protein GQ600_2106 [Phytophthora cactorum]|nr:hypothetical protein GQ600_2106 [Phytophthora cactorum]
MISQVESAVGQIDESCATRLPSDPQPHNLLEDDLEMAVNNVDHDGQLCVSRANASSFFMGSWAPTTPWELNDMDFLIPEPVVSSTRLTSRIRQEVLLHENSTSEFSSYLADDVFSDKLTAVAKFNHQRQLLAR